MLSGLCENGEGYNCNHNHSFLCRKRFFNSNTQKTDYWETFVTIFSSNNSSKNNDNLFTHITPTSLQKLVETCTCLKTTIKRLTMFASIISPNEITLNSTCTMTGSPAGNIIYLPIY